MEDKQKRQTKMPLGLRLVGGPSRGTNTLMAVEFMQPTPCSTPPFVHLRKREDLDILAFSFERIEQDTTLEFQYRRTTNCKMSRSKVLCMSMHFWFCVDFSTSHTNTSNTNTSFSVMSAGTRAAIKPPRSKPHTIWKSQVLTAREISK